MCEYCPWLIYICMYIEVSYKSLLLHWNWPKMLFGYFYIIIMPWGLNIQGWLGSWADWDLGLTGILGWQGSWAGKDLWLLWKFWEFYDRILYLVRNTLLIQSQVLLIMKGNSNQDLPLAFTIILSALSLISSLWSVSKSFKRLKHTYYVKFYQF